MGKIRRGLKETKPEAVAQRHPGTLSGAGLGAAIGFDIGGPAGAVGGAGIGGTLGSSFDPEVRGVIAKVRSYISHTPRSEAEGKKLLAQIQSLQANADDLSKREQAALAEAQKQLLRAVGGD